MRSTGPILAAVLFGTAAAAVGYTLPDTLRIPMLAGAAAGGFVLYALRERAALRSHGRAVHRVAQSMQTIQQALDRQATNIRATQQTLDQYTTNIRATQQTLDQHTTNIRATQQTLDQHTTNIQATQQTLDQHTTNIQATQQTLDQHPVALDRLRTSLLKSASQEFHQTEALLNLHSLVQVRGPLPSSRGWAASPDLLLYLVSVVLARRPLMIVELGSGVSTLWLAYAIEKAGGVGRVISLDHEPEFAARTQASLVAHGLDRFASVRVAPLVEMEIDNEMWPWYDPGALADVDSCDLLVVDGPPGVVRGRARFPALPVLHQRLADQATIVLDDCIRSDEQAIVAAWRDAFPEWNAEMLPHEKGTAVFSRKPAAE